ncbi:H-NS histone [Burkholderia ubonensis]|uniref:H-NS histone family protein n=1 Tax=Burkholderia ubonensis TaxID=101571 RepID=UPI0007563517|nr:H-NS histone family protein [Burkholderia ubonensis]KVM73923.1 H-NS histone [Burkholderia ubonensis]
MATYQELMAQAKALAAQMEQARLSERAGVINEICAKVREYGVTVEEVFGRVKHGQRGMRPASKVSPKYRDPNTGATWSGRGIEPRWIRGKNRTDFLIERE